LGRIFSGHPPSEPNLATGWSAPLNAPVLQPFFFFKPVLSRSRAHPIEVGFGRRPRTGATPTFRRRWAYFFGLDSDPMALPNGPGLFFCLPFSDPAGERQRRSSFRAVIKEPCARLGGGHEIASSGQSHPPSKADSRSGRPSTVALLIRRVPACAGVAHRFDGPSGCLQLGARRLPLHTKFHVSAFVPLFSWNRVEAEQGMNPRARTVDCDCAHTNPVQRVNHVLVCTSPRSPRGPRTST